MITKAYRYQCRATVTMSSTAIPGTPYLLKTCISLLDSKYNSTMCTEAVDLRLTRTSALIMKLYINKYPLDGLLQSRQLMCYNCWFRRQVLLYNKALSSYCVVLHFVVYEIISINYIWGDQSLVICESSERQSDSLGGLTDLNIVQVQNVFRFFIRYSKPGTNTNNWFREVAR